MVAREAGIHGSGSPPRAHALERWLSEVVGTPGLTSLDDPAEARRVLLDDALRGVPLVDDRAGLGVDERDAAERVVEQDATSPGGIVERRQTRGGHHLGEPPLEQVRQVGWSPDSRYLS